MMGAAQAENSWGKGDHFEDENDYNLIFTM